MEPGSAARYRNRFAEAASHSVRYGFEARTRIARDCGLSKMAVFRLFSGETNPSYRVVNLVVVALERALGVRLDVRELMTYGEEEWERSICDVCGCGGCYPEGALRDDGTVDPAYSEIAPGEWKSFQAIGENLTLYRREAE